MDRSRLQSPRKKSMRLRQVLVLTVASFSLHAQEPVGATSNDVNIYSLEKEAALGRQLAAEFRQRTTPIDSPSVQTYVDRLGQRLVAQVPDAKFPFKFAVVADDSCPTIHEPTALPGAYVFVPAALFLAAQDEGEFAGVLAHAIEYIAQRHRTRQATRRTMTNNTSPPLIFMGGWAGGCSENQAVPTAASLT